MLGFGNLKTMPVESPDFDLTSQDGTALNSHGSVDVETDAEWVTVAPRSFEWQGRTNYVLPSDSRPNVHGHQVDLIHGANLITVSHAPSGTGKKCCPQRKSQSIDPEAHQAAKALPSAFTVWGVEEKENAYLSCSPERETFRRP